MEGERVVPQKATSAAFRKKIGQILNSARMDRGLSSRELGRELGVTHKVILGYEHGRQMPSFATALRIMKFFNLAAKDLINCL
jgi:transcriptional regulator with XRE-family HTH domain